MNKRAALALAMGMLTTAASADSLVINGLSMHFGGGDFNELNYGMGFIHDLPGGSGMLASDYIHGGAYYNSYYDVSTYAAVGWEGLQLSKNVRLGAELGLVTGYKIMPIAPMLVPVVQVGPVRAIIMLPGCASCVAAVGFQYEVKLK